MRTPQGANDAARPRTTTSKPVKAVPADSISDAAGHADARNQQPAGPQLDPQVIDQCIEVARDIDPELGDELAAKRKNSAAEFDSEMQHGQVGRRLWAMVQLKQRDPDLYQLKISEITQSLLINRVAGRLQEAMTRDDPAEVKALREQLRNLLQIQFAMSLKARGEYLCRIEDQVRALREEIDHDAANFHQIVDARMRVLLEQPASTDPTDVIPLNNRQVPVNVEDARPAGTSPRNR
jgi:hypothetical protein